RRHLELLPERRPWPGLVTEQPGAPADHCRDERTREDRDQGDEEPAALARRLARRHRLGRGGRGAHGSANPRRCAGPRGGPATRLSTSLAPEEPPEERGRPIEALLVGVDDGLLAVVVGVVMRVRVPGDLRLDVVQDDAPDFATDVLDVDLGALENEAPDLPRLVHED